MAVDLTNPGRRVTQRRITNNRDGVLPSRRQTEAPNVAVRADLRSAARGDGGARDLARVLDEFTGSVSSAGQSYIQSSMDRYRGEAAEGLTDAAAGREDNPLLAKSRAYQEAYYSAKGEAAVNEFGAAIRSEVAQMIEDGAGPDEIDAFVLDRVSTFADDVTTRFPLPTVRQNIGERLLKTASEVEAEVGTAISERTRADFTLTEQGNLQTRIAAGEPLDVEGSFARFRAGGLSPADAKKAVIDTVVAMALDPENPQPELLAELRSSTRADGTPSFSAAEQLQIGDRLAQAQSARQRVDREEREARKTELEADWFRRALDGEYVDEEIIQAGRDGLYTPEEVRAGLSLFTNLLDADEEGYVDENFVLGIEERLARGEEITSTQVAQWLAEGRYGSGRKAREAALDHTGVSTDIRAANRSRSGGSGGEGGDNGGGWITQRQRRTADVGQARSYLSNALELPEDAGVFERRLFGSAHREFNRRVAAGEDPFEVADSLIEPFGRRIAAGYQGPQRRTSGTPQTRSGPRQVVRGPDGSLRVQ